jgi:phage-related minor tail protein
MLFGLDKARFSVQNFLAQIGSDIAEGLIRKRITDPITSGLSGIFDNLFADGAAFDRGRVTAFARGGIVDRPTLFPMANGAGLMGEAGPEAVMPLKRLGDGKLGVRAEIATQSASAADVTVNVYDNRSNRDSTPVAVSERRGGDGSRQIDVLIEDKIDAALAGGRFDPAMKSRYGARQTVRRT